MAEHGYIEDAEYEGLREEGLGLERGRRYELREEQYFFDFVQDELIERYGLKRVRQGGLEVHTTLDRHLQQVAKEAIAAHPVIGAANALVSTRTETGEIIAMASSADYDSSQFNLAAQGVRQPGSSFKPFVLTTAVDQGIDPDSTYYPAPSTITLQPDPLGEPWTVSGGGSGTMSLRQATANSINTVFAQLGLDVGADDFTEMAKEMGIESPLEPFYAYALGGTAECCTVLEMSNAYATIANGGVHHEPTAISKVVFPSGEVDEPNLEEGERVVSDGVAYEVADVMQGTLDYGTAAGNDIPCPASGKTGTTELQSDAWFVGYTPHVSTAVWTGNPDARVPLPGYGADLSAPIWHDFMLEAIGDDCDDFPEPQDPADLSSFSSDHAVSSDEIESSYETTTPTTTTNDAEEDGDGDGDGGYDPDLYAPGAGQDPESPPSNPKPEPPSEPSPPATPPGDPPDGGVDPN
jgi:penicillin-binding protein 1A